MPKYGIVNKVLLIENGLCHFFCRHPCLTVPNELDPDEKTHPANGSDELFTLHHPETKIEDILSFSKRVYVL